MLENSIFRFSDIFHVAFYFPVECLPVLGRIDFGILGIKKQNKPGKNPILMQKCKTRLSKFHMSDPPVTEGKRVSTKCQPKSSTVIEVNQVKP